MSVDSEKIAARYLLATRPIPLDTGQLRTITRDLLDKADRALDKIGIGLGDELRPGLRLAEAEYDFTNVYGDEEHVLIVLKTDRSVVRPRDIEGYFSAISGFKRNEEGKIIIIKVGHKITRSVLQSTEQTFYEILTHEMTHAKELLRDQKEPGYDVDIVFGDEEYFNDPMEVRAFMRQIVEQAWKPFKSFSKTLSEGEAMDLALNTTTWPDIKDQLTEENRKTMLKGIWRGLTERLER